MIPTIRLDDENFIDIFEKSRKMIQKVYPEWTDYNEHDPGITLLELFSWLKEMQQFYLDQIGNDNYKMYLKMLGINRKRMMPAKSLLQITGNCDFDELVMGTRFKAGTVTFETVESEKIEKNHIVKCISETLQDNNCHNIYGEEMINSGSAMNIPVFGGIPNEGDLFYVYFDKPFSTGCVHKLYVEIHDEYEVKRNEFGDYFFPLADIEMQYYSEGKYKKCSNVNDTTYGFLKNGTWSFKIDEEMEKQEEGYAIRFLLKKSEYDVVPMIKRICLNVFPIEQRDTKCTYIYGVPDVNKSVRIDNYLAINSDIDAYAKVDDGYEKISDFEVIKSSSFAEVIFKEIYDEVLIVFGAYEINKEKNFETNGFPCQRYSLGEDRIIYDSLEIIIKEKYDNKYHIWKRVEDFHCSKPEDRHYVFDEETGTIIFGDYEHGMPPLGHAGFISYATSMGVKGNIKKNKIDRVDDEKINILATNCYDISNGCEKEDFEQVFERFNREQKIVERAVTWGDYEELVNNTPGLRIKKVKAISASKIVSSEKGDRGYEGNFRKGGNNSQENEISIIVQPYSYMDKAKLTQAYYKNIYREIEQKRMIGTKVNIISPEYYGANIFIELDVHPHYSDVEEILNKVIKEYFEKDISEFGSPIIYSDIYGKIDALKCVSKIKTFSIAVQGKNVVQTKNEDIIIPANGLLYIKTVDYVISLADY